MKKYVCVLCGYVYDPKTGDPDNGVEPGTAFEDIPDDWVCPLCGAGKDDFEAQQKYSRQRLYLLEGWRCSFWQTILSTIKIFY